MVDEPNKVIARIEGEHIAGDSSQLIVVAGFNIGTGRSDPDEKGNTVPCVAVSIQCANDRSPVMLILPEHTVVDFITQLMDAKGQMIRENPKRKN